MKRFVLKTSVCLAFSFSIVLSGQTVCMKDGQPCTLDESKERQKQVCDAEEAPVNLSVDEPVKLSGILVDDLGDPVVLGRVIPGLRAVMQIRNPPDGAVLFSAPLDKDARFEFDQVPAGAFRLVAVSERLGASRRLAFIEQPKLMACTGTPDCHVEAMVHYRGTDDPIDFCPPK